MTRFVEILVVGASYITRRSGAGKGFSSFSVFHNVGFYPLERARTHEQSH